MATMDYEKLPSNHHIKVALAPSGDATGIADVGEPTAAELNNAGGTSGAINASPSISWNDFDFGIQDSETTSDPSLADAATYEDLGPAQFGGSMSFYYPAEYDDNSNNHSLVYDLTDEPWTYIDVGIRIDGAKDNMQVDFADGDFVSTYRTWTDSESNVTDADAAYRRTVGLQPAGDAAFYTIVGDHTLTAIEPSTWVNGDKGRLRVDVQDRDYTNACSFQSSDAEVVRILPGGFYEVTGTGEATITIRDSYTDESTTVAVSVS